jgi:hypothetical protein
MVDTRLDAAVDDDTEIPASERTGSAGWMTSMLCKQDKEQIDRIEEKLDKILSLLNA